MIGWDSLPYVRMMVNLFCVCVCVLVAKLAISSLFVYKSGVDLIALFFKWYKEYIKP